jgi:hypothetical protein
VFDIYGKDGTFYFVYLFIYLHFPCIFTNVTIIYIDIDIFVNSKWVDTRWQQYGTHLRTNNT